MKAPLISVSVLNAFFAKYILHVSEEEGFGGREKGTSCTPCPHTLSRCQYDVWEFLD